MFDRYEPRLSSINQFVPKVKMKPRFSLVTINKNNREGLQKTISSILALNAWPICELVIVDGNSNDGSLELARQMLRAETGVSLLREKKPGIFTAMNEGLSATRGEWIVFMNAGDCFASPDSLCGFNPSTETQIVYGNASNHEGLIMKYSASIWPWAGMPTSHQAMLFKGEFIRSRPYKTRYHLSADLEWILWSVSKRTPFEPWDKLVASHDKPGISFFKLTDRVIQCYLIALRYFLLDRNVHHYYIRKLFWAMREQGRRKDLA